MTASTQVTALATPSHVHDFDVDISLAGFVPRSAYARR